MNNLLFRRPIPFMRRRGAGSTARRMAGERGLVCTIAIAALSGSIRQTRRI